MLTVLFVVIVKYRPPVI